MFAHKTLKSSKKKGDEESNVFVHLIQKVTGGIKKLLWTWAGLGQNVRQCYVYKICGYVSSIFP